MAYHDSISFPNSNLNGQRQSPSITRKDPIQGSILKEAALSSLRSKS